MTEPLDFIYRRRSIRKFSDQPVSQADLDQLLKAAMAAPTAMNARPWEFVVVTDPEVIRKIGNSLIFGNHHPAAVIAVCGSTGVAKNLATGYFWVQDCSAAMQNILLAATALNLGSVWVGVHPIRSFVRSISHILNLPKRITPLGLVYLGHPAEQKPARSQYDEKRVHWQIYEQPQKRSIWQLFHREGMAPDGEESTPAGLDVELPEEIKEL